MKIKRTMWNDVVRHLIWKNQNSVSSVMWLRTFELNLMEMGNNINAYEIELPELNLSWCKTCFKNVKGLKEIIVGLNLGLMFPALLLKKGDWVAIDWSFNGCFIPARIDNEDALMDCYYNPYYEFDKIKRRGRVIYTHDTY